VSGSQFYAEYIYNAFALLKILPNIGKNQFMC